MTLFFYNVSMKSDKEVRSAYSTLLGYFVFLESNDLENSRRAFE